MARIFSRVVAATFCERGASLSTIETVDTENPQARAMSSSVTWPDFRWAISFPCLSYQLHKARLPRTCDLCPAARSAMRQPENPEIPQAGDFSLDTPNVCTYIRFLIFKRLNVNKRLGVAVKKENAGSWAVCRF